MEAMDAIKQKAQRAAFSAVIDSMYKKVDKNHEEGLLEIVDLAEKYMGDSFQPETYEKVREAIKDPNNKWVQFTNRLFDELDPNVLKTMALNLGFEAAFTGTKIIRQKREEEQCNIPWAILMDPTSACNLKCTGCWAAEYGNKLNLTFDELDSIVTQGKKLGIYFYLLSGGEPLVRKDDIIKLCKKHNDCAFLSFTNGTLVDQDFCDQMRKVGNLTLAISVEGFAESNDARRGQGVFEKVMHTMDLLKENGLFFGASICYTRANLETVTSDEFLDLLIEKGCRYAWYFHYLPVGNDAAPDLLPTKEQREYIYHRLREVRGMTGGKQIFAIDFQNDGEYVGGCVAGGRSYCHINANGDVEPCAFIHYSGANIRDVSLLEAFKQPLFMAYRDNQPFNDNLLRPCPMLENPAKLIQIVNESGAHSTDVQSEEPVEHLCGKCIEYAKNWQPEADELWEEHHFVKKGYQNFKKDEDDEDK